MLAHDVLRSYIDANEIDHVFSLVSDGTKKLLAKLESDDDVRVVEARHEQNAMAMADGYARATGRVGVCVVGRGPGIAQTGTSLVTARKRGSKLLVLLPDTPLSADYDTKGFQQEAYLQTMLGDVVSIRSPEVLVSRMNTVFERLERGDGPIAVQIPWDLLNAAVDLPAEWTAPAALHDGFDSGSALTPSDAAVRRAVDLYLDSDVNRAPVVLAGRGAVESGAKDALTDLAEQMGAYLTTTLQAKDFFADHPFHVGFVGTFGGSLANEIIGQTDFVYAVGCSLNPHTTDEGRLFDEAATLVHVDREPTSIGQHVPADLGIHGDAAETSQAIATALADEGLALADTYWTDAERNRIADASALDERTYPEQAERIDPRDLVRELDDALPAERLLVVDGGHFVNYVMDGISVPHPEDFVWSLDFASIGQGLPMGIGGALSAEERTCVTICGDAGFMMTLQELSTIGNEQIPMLIVVMNDEVLGSEYHQLDLIGEDASIAENPTPDLAEVASSFGIDGYTVTSVADLEDVRDVLGQPPDGPVLIDCHVNRAVRHRYYLDDHGF
jgi:thiamine pyrophosphate-dependent acetolactate synthase large subunit-like protein